MGGGTVGFPVLVLLFDQPAEVGRTFGLAVQSIGMVSASVYVLSARRPLEWRLLRPAVAGAIVGTPLGAAFVAPFVPDLWIKLVFAVIWASFGIVHLLRVREFATLVGTRSLGRRLDTSIGLLIGLSGGIVASITGVGIDMMIYTVLVLLCRTDLRIAIPTSVVLMATTSVVGIAANAALGQLAPARFALDPAVFANWIAAAPVVAVGAPFGVFIVNRLPRAPTLLIVSGLCIVQFVWTIQSENVWGWALAVTVGGLFVMIALFQAMHGVGRRRALAVLPVRSPEPVRNPVGALAADSVPGGQRGPQ
jgi:uncharacterized membrane protein YfcA